jgi:hypothetical protein
MRSYASLSVAFFWMWIKVEEYICNRCNYRNSVHGGRGVWCVVWGDINRTVYGKWDNHVFRI